MELFTFANIHLQNVFEYQSILPDRSSTEKTEVPSYKEVPKIGKFQDVGDLESSFGKDVCHFSYPLHHSTTENANNSILYKISIICIQSTNIFKFIKLNLM